MQNIVVEHKGRKFSYAGDKAKNITATCLNYDNELVEIKKSRKSFLEAMTILGMTISGVSASLAQTEAR